MGKSKEVGTEEIEGKVTINERKPKRSRGGKPKKSWSGKSSAKKFDGGEDFTYRSNSPQWYFKDKQTLDAVASFSYATPLGSDLLPTEVYDTGAKETLSGFTAAVPGLMSIDVGLTPGIADNAQDPVNLAAQNVYSYVRYKNSGGKNYDAPDLMLYLLTLDSIYACWSWLKRIYGYTSTYSQVNKYKPKAYAMADKVDLDDIYAHLADFRAYINMTADRISAFCVPATMTYNVRHAWLFSNIFTDSDAMKPQEYIYVPSWFYQYDEVTSSKGGQLIAVDVNYTKTAAGMKLKTFADLRKLMDDLINAAMYSEDIGVMSGDILKAYGEGNLFKLSRIDADYRIESVFDKAALSQIENANTWFTHYVGKATGLVPISTWNVTQDPNTNYLKFRPTFTSEAPLEVDCPIGAYLNFHWSNPTPEDVIEATRLSWTGEIAGDNKTFTLTSVGSEIVMATSIYVFMQTQDYTQPYVRYAPMKIVEMPCNGRTEADSGFVGGWQPWFHVGTVSADMERQGTDLLAFLWNWMAFDWAPAIMLRVDNDIEGTVTDFPFFREWANYTVLGYSNVTALNTLAILSEFNVPN